jgi:hypothetical protein
VVKTSPTTCPSLLRPTHSRLYLSHNNTSYPGPFLEKVIVPNAAVGCLINTRGWSGHRQTPLLFTTCMDSPRPIPFRHVTSSPMYGDFPRRATHTCLTTTTMPFIGIPQVREAPFGFLGSAAPRRARSGDTSDRSKNGGCRFDPRQADHRGVPRPLHARN